ncbi:response regulator [bacterium]|nr:response regulator [bacterium]
MKKILIADDAKLMRDIIEHVLNETGQFEIINAHNGREAIDKYKSHKPDVVTMDITMDEKNGLEATQEIMAFDANAKIIIVTSLGQDKLLNACLASGARDYIIKPFSKDRIKASILNALEDTSIVSKQTHRSHLDMPIVT